MLAAPSLPPLAPGQIVGERYRVDRVVAHGGMSSVLAATDVVDGAPVAIKMLRGDAERSPTQRERFQREIRVLARLHSEHGVRMLGSGQLPSGTPYMVLEYLDGVTLDELVQTHGPLDVTAAVDYVLQACEVLSEAHADGVVHRDIKSANLFLARRADGTPWIKLLDFGLSKAKRDGAARSEDDLSVTRGTDVIGSPQYMAPEQMISTRTVDRSADIWSLGVVLYELLTGRVPFDATGAAALRAQIMFDAPTPPSVLRPELPAGLELVVLRCLAKLPNERFRGLGVLAASLSPFASALGKACEERVMARAPRNGPPPLPPIAATPAAAPVSNATLPRQEQLQRSPGRWTLSQLDRAHRRRHSVLAAVSALFFTLGLCIGVVLSLLG